MSQLAPYNIVPKMLLFVVMQMESGADMMGYSGNGVNQLADYFMSLEPPNPSQPNQVIDDFPLCHFHGIS